MQYVYEIWKCHVGIVNTARSSWSKTDNRVTVDSRLQKTEHRENERREKENPDRGLVAKLENVCYVVSTKGQQWSSEIRLIRDDRSKCSGNENKVQRTTGCREHEQDSNCKSRVMSE